MTDDINRLIAEALEPEPTWKDEEDTVYGVLSDGKCWEAPYNDYRDRYDVHYSKAEPREFDKDDASVPMLLEELGRRHLLVSLDNTYDGWRCHADRASMVYKGVITEAPTIPAAVAKAMAAVIEGESDAQKPS